VQRILAVLETVLRGFNNNTKRYTRNGKYVILQCYDNCKIFEVSEIAKYFNPCPRVLYTMYFNILRLLTQCVMVKYLLILKITNFDTLQYCTLISESDAFRCTNCTIIRNYAQLSKHAVVFVVPGLFYVPRRTWGYVIFAQFLRPPYCTCVYVALSLLFQSPPPVICYILYDFYKKSCLKDIRVQF
jgi:hypothetical protein